MKNKPKFKKGRGALYYVSLFIFIASVGAFVGYGGWYLANMYINEKNAEDLRDIRNKYSRDDRGNINSGDGWSVTPTETAKIIPTPGITGTQEGSETITPTPGDVIPDVTGTPDGNSDVTPGITSEPTPTPGPDITSDPHITQSPDIPDPTDMPYVTLIPTPTEDPNPLPNGDPTPIPTATPTATPTPTPTPLPPEPDEYGKEMTAINPEWVGHLEIINTNPAIDYEVVTERVWDESFYLRHDFYGSYNINGTLFTVKECNVGVGKKSDNYAGGSKPSTNIIIFGHNMINDTMFGNLDQYLKQSYYEKHKYIYFDTAYENRTYEVIAVFRSHEFEDPLDDNFKYYFFYNANTELDFDYWYSNIMSASVIDATATAKYGDEFLTLSTCSKTDETGARNENGRLAVIAVRVE